MNQIHRPILSMVAGVAMLGGCAEQRAGMVSRFLSDDSARTAYSAAPAALAAGRPADSGFGAGSDIIARLQARRSVLTPASPYDQVAEAVLAADARVAESELRAAQLRAEAASRNWLPTIGPRISLTSLGELVADLVINQVLFDNGRKQAERDLAQAEVELAAVALAEDGNTRVNAALTLYLRMEEGRETAALLDHSLGDMAQFEWVMDQRVRGGVSDMSDLNVVRQKLADIRARSMAAREQVTTAQAELAAMATRPLGDLHGQTGLGAAPGGLEATAVLRARAEMARALAQAQIERAAHLPGLSAGGSTGGSGQNLGLQVQTDQLFGLGTVASL
ncbi:TolC family protein, partial [Puniceibacterium confluentis]